MEWFSRPDFNLTLVRRRAGDALLDMAVFWGGLAINPAGSLYRGLRGGGGRSSSSAYWNAVRRLERQGLLIRPRRGGRSPVLLLTDRARDSRPIELNPAARWDAKWNGRWYLLTYDIPETERRYRTAVRGFLRRQRMGYLQNSVWISAFDIRPVFDDLCRGAALEDFAYVFEARTVLGLASQAIVNASWDLKRVQEVQRWYVAQAERLLDRIERESLPAAALEQVAREDAACYLAAMREDPLLPASLYPADYLGPRVYKTHFRLQGALAKRFHAIS